MEEDVNSGLFQSGFSHLKLQTSTNQRDPDFGRIVLRIVSKADDDMLTTFES